MEGQSLKIYAQCWLILDYRNNIGLRQGLVPLMFGTECLHAVTRARYPKNPLMDAAKMCLICVYLDANAALRSMSSMGSGLTVEANWKVVPFLLHSLVTGRA